MPDDTTSGERPHRTAQKKRQNGGAERRSPKISETVALEIVRDITDQGLKSGDRLPREADMLEYYRVSRSSLREALRLLEVQGLIRIRPGPGGGPVVDQANPGNLSRTLRLHLHLLGATYDDLLTAWHATDPVLAAMAARNPDREAVRAAMEPHLENPPGEDVRRHGEQFHVAVAKLADNPVLSYVFRAMTAAMEDHVVEAVRQLDFDDEIVHEHRQVAAAIIKGDADKAFKLMDSHVADMISHFREYLPRVIGDRIALS